jgi:hypothetical protein
MKSTFSSFSLKGFVSTSVILVLFFASTCSPKKIRDESWLDPVFEEGRILFYRTTQEEIRDHPERSWLSDEEITKITEAETRYPRLYELLVNIFYQKDEPTFSMMIQKRDKASRSRFRDMFLDLTRFSAHMFVECFFATDRSTELIRGLIPHYKELDAVDLVLRSVGYQAKLDIPIIPAEIDPLSPEFDKQGGLDGARFRKAFEITKGKGAKIAVLDTGIDQSHPVFGHTSWGRHFSLVGREGRPWEAKAPVVDWGSHGTLISSVVACYAPEAQITMYKFGDGDTQNDPPFQLLAQCILAASIYRAVHDDQDIISISASGSSLDLDYLREACRYAHEKNKIVISGNLYSRWYKQGNVSNFPSQYESVVSVTAAERRKDGTYGYWDVCAPYNETAVAAPNDVFGAFPTYIGEKDTYIPSISAAIPVVAALCALAISECPPSGKEGPGEYADMIVKLVLDSADPRAVGYGGFSPECGYGLIDAEKTVMNAGRRCKGRLK